jgi:hypothetical protein
MKDLVGFGVDLLGAGGRSGHPQGENACADDRRTSRGARI